MSVPNPFAPTTTAVAALNAASLEQIAITPRNNIGGVEVQATLEEVYNDSLQLTDHPVEAGAQITDHSFKRPTELVLRCGWSNSSPQALVGAATALAGAASAFAQGLAQGADLRTAGAIISDSIETANSFVSSIYSQLRALQQSRQPLTVTTSLRQYSNMLITNIAVQRDTRSANSVLASVTLREVILVSTVTSTLPPQANQANPASTAGVQNLGQQQLGAAVSPSPGGAPNPFTVTVGGQ